MMSSREPRVECPLCGGHVKNSLKRQLDPTTPETDDCVLCGGTSNVPRSVAVDWSMQEYIEFKRNQRKRWSDE